MSKTYTLKEVGEHKDGDSMWLVVDSGVYDISSKPPSVPLSTCSTPHPPIRDIPQLCLPSVSLKFLVDKNRPSVPSPGDTRFPARARPLQAVAPPNAASLGQPGSSLLQ